MLGDGKTRAEHSVYLILFSLNEQLTHCSTLQRSFQPSYHRLISSFSLSRSIMKADQRLFEHLLAHTSDRTLRKPFLKVLTSF